MKSPISFLCLAGLAAGAMTAWLAPLLRPKPVTTPTNVPGPVSTLLGSDKAASKNSGILASWTALQSTALSGLPRRLALSSLVAQANSAEIPELLKLTDRDPAMRELLLRRWVELDPTAVSEWLAPRMGGLLNGPDEHADDVTVVFSAWAERDPAAAIAKIRANAGKVHGIGFNILVLNRLMETDVAAGIKFGSLTESVESAVGIIWNPGSFDWVRKNPAKTAELLSALPPGEFRDVSLRKTIAALAKNDLRGAIALQQKFPDLAGLAHGQGANWRADFFAQWAKADLAGMTAFVNDKAGGETRQDMKEAIAKNLGEKDPEAGLAWAAENLSGDRRHEAVKEILTRLAKDNPEGALRYLDSMPGGSALNRAVETFSGTFPADDFAGLLSKAGSLPEGAARQSLTAKAYEKWYQKEPAALLQNLAQQDPGSLPPGIWGSLGQQTGSITEGVERLETIPPESSVEFVRNLCQRHFGMNDPLEKMTQAVDEFKSPGHRAAAIEALSNRWYWWRGVQGLIDWAAALPSASERKIVADQILKNPGGLTPAEREKLVAPLR